MSVVLTERLTDAQREHRKERAREGKPQVGGGPLRGPVSVGVVLGACSAWAPALWAPFRPDLTMRRDFPVLTYRPEVVTGSGLSPGRAPRRHKRPGPAS